VKWGSHLTRVQTTLNKLITTAANASIAVLRARFPFLRRPTGRTYTAPIDDATVTHLEDKSDRYTDFAEWGAKALIVGLLVELLYEVFSDRPWQERVILVVADALVTGGVGAEVYFARLSRAIDNVLKIDAKLRLAAAIDRASVADQKAAEATERAANALRAAESERLERTRLEERLAPRTFTGAQSQRIIEKMGAFAGVLFFITVHSSGDAEGLGHLIRQVLHAAGWRGTIGIAQSAFFIRGVVVDASNSDESAGRALVTALNEAGISAMYGPRAVQESKGFPAVIQTAPGQHARDMDETLRIFVGIKP
jgi:hypothetical protein